MSASVKQSNWLVEQLDRHGLTLVIGAALIYSTFNSNDQVTAQKIAEMDAKQNEILATLSRLEATRTCQIRTLDKIVDRTGISPPCELAGQ